MSLGVDPFNDLLLVKNVDENKLCSVTPNELVCEVYNGLTDCTGLESDMDKLMVKNANNQS